MSHDTTRLTVVIDDEDRADDTTGRAWTATATIDESEEEITVGIGATAADALEDLAMELRAWERRNGVFFQ